MHRRFTRSLAPRRTAATLVAGSILAAAAFAPAALAGDQTTVTLRTELFGSFSGPMGMKVAPGDDANLYVFERAGRIRIVDRETGTGPLFLNITGLVSTTFEGGLLGLAFPLDHATTGKFYVHYTAPNGGGLQTRIVEYQRDAADPTIADPGSARTILQVNQPAANHNGGSIECHPFDGTLHVSLGDGGFSGSGQARAQDLTNQWLGKILRVDPSGDDFPADPNRNYAIPADNPYVGLAGDDEIWASGVRNPFRTSFDPETGDMWIGDVGEGAWEEVNVIPNELGGANLGWGCMEGFQCFGNQCTCNDPSLTLPVQVYSHSVGFSISGGRVYRGCAIPELDGVYFYGDFGSNKIWTLIDDGFGVQNIERTAQLNQGTDLVVNPVGFGEDQLGELYIISLSGKIMKIVSDVPPVDENGNGIPDSCEKSAPSPDLDGDGDVDFADLLAMLSAWGPCAGCPADLDQDGEVGFADVLSLLSAWTG
ncbi:MAG: PQQ-dependent sugar dehydrogenase [Phycisphaerales bacterium]